MKIELIASGDEIITGALTDTNSSRLAHELTMRGHEVPLIHAVGDDVEAIRAMLLECAARSDAVICAGGLGPTQDDLTTEAAAKAAGLELEFHEEEWKFIEERFNKINLPLSPTNKKQAMLPKGCEVLSNPIGTAPGFMLKIKGKPCFFAPGVPRELFKMFDEQIMPRLEKLRPESSVYASRVWRTFGGAESSLGEWLKDVAVGNDNIRLSFRASFPEIRVGLSARGKTMEEASALLDKTAVLVEDKIGDWAFSRDGRSMAETVGAMLIDKGLTLALAESCTGGLIGKMLTDAPGSSAYFKGGIVCYSNDLKIDLLKVNREIIETHGAVSEECALAMSENAREIVGADFGLSVTGVAGPSGGADEKPVGTVYISCAAPHGTEVRGGQWPRGNREQIRLISAFAALDLIRKTLAETG